MLLSLAFPASLLLSMPFTYSRRYSWRVQLALVVLPLALLVLLAFVATRI